MRPGAAPGSANIVRIPRAPATPSPAPAETRSRARARHAAQPAPPARPRRPCAGEAMRSTRRSGNSVRWRDAAVRLWRRRTPAPGACRLVLSDRRTGSGCRQAEATRPRAWSARRSRSARSTSRPERDVEIGRRAPGARAPAARARSRRSGHRRDRRGRRSPVAQPAGPSRASAGRAREIDRNGARRVDPRQAALDPVSKRAVSPWSKATQRDRRSLQRRRFAAWASDSPSLGARAAGAHARSRRGRARDRAGWRWRSR